MATAFSIRRAYNSKNWDKAIILAKQRLEKNLDDEFSQGIIIRAYYNKKEYSQCKYFWELYELAEFESLYQNCLTFIDHIELSNEKILSKVERLQKSQPKPKYETTWNPNCLEKMFSQEENKVWLKTPESYVFWEMPDDFILSEVHVDLLRLVTEILLYPFHKRIQFKLLGSRRLGSRPALSFSAGTDSTAASLVMPDNTILGYHKRSFESMIDHRNAERLIEYMKKDGHEIISIMSNHELIRTYHDKAVGFSCDFASATHLILLADYFDIGSIAFGTPIDNTWLWKGRKFRNFEESDYWKKWSSRFLSAGIELCFPIAGISEAGCLKICQLSKLLNYLNSCLRGDGVSGCGKCWKCFNKNGPLGRSYDVNSNEIKEFLQKRPMPTATNAIWVLKEMNLEYLIPDLYNLTSLDLSWWTMAYPPAKEIIPSRWRNEIWTNILSYLREMPEPYLISEVNHFNE